MSLQEAAEYSGIGINRLRELASSDDCKFVLRVGNRRNFSIRVNQFSEEMLEIEARLWYDKRTTNGHFQRKGV